MLQFHAYPPVHCPRSLKSDKNQENRSRSEITMPEAPVCSSNFVCTVFRPALRRRFLLACSSAMAALLFTCAALADIPLSTSTAATQNFDGMGSSATALVPADFRVDALSIVRTVGTFS